MVRHPKTANPPNSERGTLLQEKSREEAPICENPLGESLTCPDSCEQVWRDQGGWASWRRGADAVEDSQRWTVYWLRNTLVEKQLAGVFS